MRGSRTERCGRAPAFAYLGEGGARARDRDCSFSSSIGGAAASAPTERLREPAFVRGLDLFLIALRFDSALESKNLLWQKFLPLCLSSESRGDFRSKWRSEQTVLEKPNSLAKVITQIIKKLGAHAQVTLCIANVSFRQREVLWLSS